VKRRPPFSPRSFGAAKPLDAHSKLGLSCAEVAQRAKQDDVRFLMTSNIGHQIALAYGYPGRRRIECGGGMRLVAAKDLRLVRAVIAHEIGHLRHGDVDFAYITRGLVWATVWLAVLTSLIYLAGLVAHLGSPMAAGALSALWNDFGQGRVGAGFALKILREWVTSYGISPLFLLANLTFFLVVIYLENDRPSRWTLLRLHPDFVSRRHVMERPERLLRPTSVQALASGYILGLFISYLTTYTASIRPNTTGTGWMVYPLPACCDVTQWTAALSQNPLFLARLILFVGAAVLGLAIYGSLNLRLSALAGLGVISRLRLAVLSVALALAFGCGLAKRSTRLRSGDGGIAGPPLGDLLPLRLHTGYRSPLGLP
jgi:hypothetical protein